jgi:hypothetical protein
MCPPFYHLIGVNPFSINLEFTVLNGLEPKNPLYEESGLG